MNHGILDGLARIGGIAGLTDGLRRDLDDIEGRAEA
jgi:hypothetical protein